MRRAMKFGWAAAVGLTISGSAVAQTTGGTGGSTGGTGGSAGGIGSGQNALGGSGGTSQLAPTTVLDSTAGSQIGAGTLNQSNVLSGYYANPLYQGRAGAATGETPGGFGSPLYTSTTGTTGGFAGATGGRTSTTGGRTTTGGATGGRTTTGGTTGFGSTGTATGGRAGGTTGFGGTGTTTGGFGGATTGGRAGTTGLGGRTTGARGFGTQSAGQVVPLPRPIAYTAEIRFARPAVAPTRVQTDVRAMLDRSASLTSARNIEVVADGGLVTLRGAVKDEDEARLAEGMIRLTPGVRDVRNELTFPPSQP